MSESPSTDSVWGWRGAASGIVESMNRILDTEERSDVVFAVGREHGEEQMFRAHKFVLSLRSDVFDAMFYGEAATTEKTIELPDILPEAFGVMLKHMYTDDVEDLTVENVMPTLYCAKKYGIPKLHEICAKYAAENVDKDSCLTLLEAAKVLDVDEVVSKCLKIVDSRCTDVLQSDGFLLLKNETVREIFSRDTLIVNEEDVYKAAVRWATNACQFLGIESTAVNCRFVLGETLKFVRFPLMDDEQLASGPVAAGFLLDDESRSIYQFKYATEKPDIPFSGTDRSSEIAFCGRQWQIADLSDRSSLMAGKGNVFLDEHGHLHLRVSQRDGVWKGAGVKLLNALGCGRYEFHIERLDRLDPGAGFGLRSQFADGPAISITIIKMPVPDGDGRKSYNGVHFAVRRTGGDSAHLSSLIEGDTRTTHCFHRRPDSVSFSSQRGYQRNNTEEELCSWLYDSVPNIPEIALPLYLVCTAGPVDNPPYDRKEVEIVVRSFQFYPDE